jgi:hypothetical protein
LGQNLNARIELLDIAGRQIEAVDLSSLQPETPFHVTLGGRQALAPGVYVIRLSAYGAQRTAKALVVR